MVIASAKQSGFIAGADIDDLDEVDTASKGRELSKLGQKAMDRLESLPVPTVAAIHGDCLGGGLELALACTARVASNSSRTKLALPEVMLGLLPGGGGDTAFTRSCRHPDSARHDAHRKKYTSRKP